MTTTAAAPAETGLVGGMVTFRIGARAYATRLDDVREVVRLQGLADLPGMRPPLAGVLDLRGDALPVLDLRGAREHGTDGGDVLVLAGNLRALSDGAVDDGAVDDGAVDDGAVDRGADDGALVGVAVDEVCAVLPADELVPAGTGDSGVLPSYVVQVLRGPDGVVFLVDLERMVRAAQRAG